MYLGDTRVGGQVLDGAEDLAGTLVVADNDISELGSWSLGSYNERRQMEKER